MKTETEDVKLAGGPAHLRVMTIPAGAFTVTVDRETYRDTGRRFGGWNCPRNLYPDGYRLFTRSGRVRYITRHPAGSLEALVCEAEGREPVLAVVYGPALSETGDPR